MNTRSPFSALSSRRIALLIGTARNRVIYAAPGIQNEAAVALAKCATNLGADCVTVSIDLDQTTIRMGYGSVEGVKELREAGVDLTQSPGFRSGILIIDERGWVFTPTALYLEQEPQSDETPNALELSQSQVENLAVRLSRKAHSEAFRQAETPEQAQEIEKTRLELGIAPVSKSQFDAVKAVIDLAPPVKFDVVRQVRVFEPYLQYVELSLSGAAVQRQRVQIPKDLQNLGTSKDLEGRLRTTFDLIEKDGALSSKALEDELNEIRKNLTPSLGSDHGRVMLKSNKPLLLKRLAELREKLQAHQNKVEKELQSKLEKSKKEVVDYYFPRVKDNPPDALVGGVLNLKDGDIKAWLEEQLDLVFPRAEDLIQGMTLMDRYKDVTYETLNKTDFVESLQRAFPRIDWEKPYKEFQAMGERAKQPG